MTIAPNGDAHGTLTRSDGTIELTSTGGSSYYRADAAFWKAEAGPQAALLYADKYVFVPSAQSRFASLTDFATFFSTLLTAHGKLSKGHRTHFHGRKVVEVLDGSGGSLFVSVTGVPYPLGGSTGNGGILTLDRWNAPFSVQAPPAIEVITPTPTAAPS
jgi:hypothetical protein